MLFVVNKYNMNDIVIVKDFFVMRKQMFFVVSCMFFCIHVVGSEIIQVREGLLGMPKEIIYSIVSFCSLNDIGNLKSVCKKLSKNSTDGEEYDYDFYNLLYASNNYILKICEDNEQKIDKFYCAIVNDTCFNAYQKTLESYRENEKILWSFRMQFYNSNIDQLIDYDSLINQHIECIYKLTYDERTQALLDCVNCYRFNTDRINIESYFCIEDGSEKIRYKNRACKAEELFAILYKEDTNGKQIIDIDGFNH
jgi:hypothetical protein